jgi:hypothetical protein
VWGSYKMEMIMYGRWKGHTPPARTMWRRAFGAAPRDRRVKAQERINTLDRKVGAKRETFPRRSPAEAHSPGCCQLWPLLVRHNNKNLERTGGVSDRHMRLLCDPGPGSSTGRSGVRGVQIVEGIVTVPGVFQRTSYRLF